MDEASLLAMSAFLFSGCSSPNGKARKGQAYIKTGQKPTRAALAPISKFDLKPTELEVQRKGHTCLPAVQRTPIESQPKEKPRPPCTENAANTQKKSATRSHIAAVLCPQGVVKIDEATVAPGERISVNWVMPQDIRSGYACFRALDFLALHRDDQPADKYESSLYMLGEVKGRNIFIAPNSPGQYCISVVRDLNQVLEGIPDLWKNQDFIQFMKNHGTQNEHLVLGSASFTVYAGYG